MLLSPFTQVPYNATGARQTLVMTSGRIRSRQRTGTITRMVGLCVGDSSRVARLEFRGHPDPTRCMFYMGMKMIHPCTFTHPIHGTLVVLLRNESLQKFGCITLQIVWETFLPAKGAWGRISLLFQSSWKKHIFLPITQVQEWQTVGA